MCAPTRLARSYCSQFRCAVGRILLQRLDREGFTNHFKRRHSNTQLRDCGEQRLVCSDGGSAYFVSVCAGAAPTRGVDDDIHVSVVDELNNGGFTVDDLLALELLSHHCCGYTVAVENFGSAFGRKNCEA